MLAVRARQAGGPEVLEAVDVPVPTAGAGQILVRHEAVGLNYIDTYQRSGLYPIRFPAVLGMEAAGRVEAVGEGVDRFKVGDAVAYAGGAGAYGEFNAVPAARAVALPAAVSTRIAAAALLKGMTVEYLLCRCFPVRAGQSILVHAAAGGVGTILIQWAKAIGAHVIGTVGSEEKAAVASSYGCDEVILYRREDVAERVRALTGGEGVPVVYDSVGKDTFEASLGALARRGTLVSFGNASGAVTAISPLVLMQRGSLFFTRPTLMDYTASREDLELSAGALFAMLESGKVKVDIGQTFPLKDARAAHEALESRATVGASLLIP
jgi:NADPH2:quinone reductase